MNQNRCGTHLTRILEKIPRGCRGDLNVHLLAGRLLFGSRRELKFVIKKSVTAQVRNRKLQNG